MKFDVNRLSRLAGLGGSTSLNEAANRSHHDDPALAKETEVVHGKGQLAEREDFETHKGEKDADGHDAFRGMRKGDRQGVNEQEMSDEEELKLVSFAESDHSDANEMHHSEMNEDEDFTTKKGMRNRKGDVAYRGMRKGDEASEMVYRSDEMVQLDEEIIRKELIEMRKEKLQETALRRAIRNEIRGVVKDLDVYASSNWLYGDNKPKRSRKGQIHMGAPGIGFKGYKG